ncbi:MAG TPA: ATP-binding protein [Actinocrinis sp.]|nr:ATP-binding protein [Actinocrinis sp.]
MSGSAHTAYPLTTSIRLAAVLTAARFARLFVENALSEWQLDDLTDTATLLVSELVTNAVKATGNTEERPDYIALMKVPVIRLQVRANATSVVIEVWDNSRTEIPAVHTKDDDDEGGRGLFIVATLSKNWGIYYPRVGGKVVWALVAREEPTPQPLQPLSRQTLPTRVPQPTPARSTRQQAVADVALLERVLWGLRKYQLTT